MQMMLIYTLEKHKKYLKNYFIFLIYFSLLDEIIFLKIIVIRNGQFTLLGFDVKLILLLSLSYCRNFLCLILLNLPEHAFWVLSSRVLGVFHFGPWVFCFNQTHQNTNHGLTKLTNYFDQSKPTFLLYWECLHSTS